MSRPPVIAVLLLLATASAALAAARLSEPQYIRAATKICKQRTKEAAAFPRLPKNVSTRRFTARLTLVVPIYQRADRRFHGLNRPRSLRYLVPPWLRSEDARVQALKQALAAGLKGNRAGMFTHANDSTVYGAQAIQLAQDIGITHCQ